MTTKRVKQPLSPIQHSSGFIPFLPYLIFGVGLAARLWVFGELATNAASFAEPAVDARWHLLWAREIVAGDFWGSGIFFRAPLYPYFLAGIISVLGDSLWAVRIVHALLGSVSCVLVYLLGKRLFSAPVGTVAALLWALWPTAIYYESELLIPVLIIPLNLWALYVLAGAIQRRRLTPRVSLGVGLILGISAIARPNILLFVIALLIWILWRFRASARSTVPSWILAVSLLVGTSLPVSIVTVRNAVVADDFVPISYQGGINLYLGNNKEADGLTMVMPQLRYHQWGDWSTFVRTTDSLAIYDMREPLKPSEISNYWMKKTFSVMLKNPGHTLGLLGKKLYYFWHGWENGDQWDIYTYAKNATLLRLGIHHTLLWFPLGLFSAFGLWGMWAARRDGPAVESMLLFVGTYLLSVVGFLVTARHRLPVVPLILIFAIVAFPRLWHMARERPTSARAIGTWFSIAVLLFITNVSRFGVGSANMIHYHYQQGVILDRQGEYRRAIAAYERALALWPNHFFSRHNLAYDLYRLGRYEDAIDNYIYALGAKPGDAMAYNNLGLAYRESGDTSRAIGVFQRAIRANPRLIEAHLNLGDARRDIGEYAEAEEAYLAGLAIDSTFAPILNNLGLLYIDQSRRDRAEVMFTRCVESSPQYPYCWLNIAALYLQTDRPGLAIEPLQKYLQMKPGDIGAEFKLAIAYIGTGQRNQGQKLLDQILRKDPDHSGARALMEQILNRGL